MSDPNQPSNKKEEKGPVDSPWVESFNSQQDADRVNQNAAARRSFENVSDTNGDLQPFDMIMDIPVKLTVELGRTKMTIRELLSVSEGALVKLEALTDEPLDILINGYLVAQGEIVVVADKYGMRITDVINTQERMRRLTSL